MALVNHKVKSKYSYHPKTEEQLMYDIYAELNNGNTDLNCIDTSGITEMGCLFSQEEGILLLEEQQETLDISKWDVSNVKDMRYMFENCEQINCDISNWDVSNVTVMYNMFWGCKKFNQDLSKWNVTIKNNNYLANMFHKSSLEGKEPKWYKK